jgi:hypothetical protein
MPALIGMSERQYAEHAKISRPAVAKARMMGRLVLHPDGSIDAAGSDRRRAENTDPARQRSPAGPARTGGGRVIPEAAASAVIETLREQGMAGDGAGSGGGITFASARTANEVMKAQLRRIELQRQKGELIDRSRALATVFRLARQERDAWLGWPARVAPQMAADLGCETHTMQQILDRYVRSHLVELGEIRLELS